jgi:hypothetical protein
MACRPVVGGSKSPVDGGLRQAGRTIPAYFRQNALRPSWFERALVGRREKDVRRQLATEDVGIQEGLPLRLCHRVTLLVRVRGRPGVVAANCIAS